MVSPTAVASEHQVHLYSSAADGTSNVSTLQIAAPPWLNARTYHVALHCVSAADSISIRLRRWMIIAVDGLATSKMKARVIAAGVQSSRAVIYIGQLAWPRSRRRPYATFRIIFPLHCQSDSNVSMSAGEACDTPPGPGR